MRVLRRPLVCAARFRARAEELGLVVTLDGTLATIPGSIHLHLRLRGERAGTMVYTMDVRAQRSWLSWTEKRHRPWVDSMASELKRRLGG